MTSNAMVGLTLLANAQPYVTVEELLRSTRRLLREHDALAATVPERHLHDEFSYHPRTLAQQLGHLAEQRRYVARQLTQWQRGQRLVLGRPDAGDADLEDGLLRATMARLQTLTQDLEESAVELETALARLDDAHLRATVHDVVRGREPLASHLTRVVIDHGRGHSDELAWCLKTLVESRP